MTAFRRLLVATDYSPCSAAAYEVGLRIAGEFGASVDLVHVWSAPYFEPGYGYEGSAVFDPVQHQSLFDMVRQRALEDMRAFAASPKAARTLRVATHVESGEPARKVLEMAERSSPDLIVLGTHGRTGADRWLFGSVAARIIRHASSAVLTVPLPVGFSGSDHSGGSGGDDGPSVRGTARRSV